VIAASHREDPQHHGRPSELIEDIAIHGMWLHPIATHPVNLHNEADKRVDVTIKLARVYACHFFLISNQDLTVP